jgi:hypothetical protein
MLKLLIPAAIALVAATPALAQNDNAPMAGRMEEWRDAPAKPAAPSLAVTFTAVGTYSDAAGLRAIDVRADSDIDGDGAMDQGVLRVACNGGDILTGSFVAGTAPAGGGKKLRAEADSALAPGKPVKARWDGTGGGTERAVTLGKGQAAVCSGLG